MENNQGSNTNREKLNQATSNDEYYTDWSHIDGNINNNSEEVSQDNNYNKKSFLWKFFIGSFIILAAALVYAGVNYYLGKNTISNDKISLSINIDDNVKGGQPGNMSVSIQNNNSLAINNAKVTLRVQKGFSADGVVDQEIKNFNIGNIDPTVYVSTTTEYVFNGQEGDIRKIFLTLEYNVQGSNSSFKKDLSKDVKIISPSIALSIDGNKDIIEDHDYSYKFTVKNVSYDGTDGLMLRVSPPPGFLVEQTASSSDPTKFVIQDLKVGDSKEYIVKGHFKTVLTSNQTFNGAVSTYNGETEKSLITNSVYEVKLVASPISYNYKIGVDGGDAVAFDLGRRNSLLLTIKNVSDNYVSEVVVIGKVSNNNYTFNKISNPALEKINPGEESVVELYGMNLVNGKNKFEFEVYGKTRSSGDTVLLKRFNFELGAVNGR
ncbi:MAG: hypothetical protein QG614_62 [Patescibacteria group bacterium]|nr:hypothetical protein [Patescibacteria group bacterium]